MPKLGDYNQIISIFLDYFVRLSLSLQAQIVKAHLHDIKKRFAKLAQLVEQRIRNA